MKFEISFARCHQFLRPKITECPCMGQLFNVHVNPMHTNLSSQCRLSLNCQCAAGNHESAKVVATLVQQDSCCCCCRRWAYLFRVSPLVALHQKASFIPHSKGALWDCFVHGVVLLDNVPILSILHMVSGLYLPRRPLIKNVYVAIGSRYCRGTHIPLRSVRTSCNFFTAAA